MADEISAPGESGEVRREWERLIEKWEMRDRAYLEKLSGASQKDEEILSAEKQKEAISRRQLEACLGVVSLAVTPNVSRREYFPGPLVIEETTKLLRTDEIREKIKTLALQEEREIPNDLIMGSILAMEVTAISEAMQRRYYAELCRAQDEAKSPSQKAIWGLLALMSTHNPKRAREVQEAVFSPAED